MKHVYNTLVFIMNHHKSLKFTTTRHVVAISSLFLLFLLLVSNKVQTVVIAETIFHHNYNNQHRDSDNDDGGGTGSISTRRIICGNTRKDNKQRRIGNSLRGFAAAENNNDNDPWWQDSFLMETREYPMEEKEIRQQQQQHSSTGPMIGPVVHVPANLPTSNEQQYRDYEEQPMTRIIHGEGASPHSFFTMLLIRFDNEWRWSGCGGTLISSCHVVTVAHCFINPAITVEGVFVNAHSPFSVDDSGGGSSNNNIPFHFSLIQQVEMHPNFNPSTNQADIAILTLEECVDTNRYSNNFVPVTLATDKEEYYQSKQQQQEPLMMKVLGFGSMSDQANVRANTLQQVHLPFISHQDCRQYYPGGELLPDMVCAGYPETGGSDACQGDSGGGMLHYNNYSSDDTPVLVGLVSWGIGCGRRGFPGVYIYIPYYRDWILGRICPVSNSVYRDGASARANNYQDVIETRSWCRDAGKNAVNMQQEDDDVSGRNDDDVGNDDDDDYKMDPTSAPTWGPTFSPTWDTTVIPTRFPTNKPPTPMPTPQPHFLQQQQVTEEESDVSSTCRNEGKECSDGRDCCSSFCRGFVGVELRVCSGVLPTHQKPSLVIDEELQTTQQRLQSYTNPQKRGGAAGVKRQQPRSP